MSSEAITIGVSACLLGHPVRYDGRDKREAAVAELLARDVEFAPVCPEFELGMGVPRESIELYRLDGIRLLGVESRRDHTAAMDEFAARRLDELRALPIAGYIFKARSPSCGVSSVPIFDNTGTARPDGRGMFARALIERFPHMPVVEETDVRDPGPRASFLVRVRAYRRLDALLDPGDFSIGRLVAFHSREKMLLSAHHDPSYRELGRLVARARDMPVPTLRSQYRAHFMAALHRRPTRGQHVNTLQHLVGMLARHMSPEERVGITRWVDEYARGAHPLDRVLARIRTLAQRYERTYVYQQSYLDERESELLAHAQAPPD